MLQPLRHTKNCTHDYERLQSENTWNRPSKDVNWVYKWAAHAEQGSLWIMFTPWNLAIRKCLAGTRLKSCNSNEWKSGCQRAAREITTWCDIFFFSFSFIDSRVEKMPYSCKHCNKCFSRSSVCKEHERIHAEVKQYKCRHCEKCFIQSADCKKHERTHTGVKPYTCKHCKKSFSQLRNCKRHERTHTGVKPYTCKHCKKCFSQLGNCKRHERTHTGVKPYTCKQCKKCFSRLENYKRHERTHTGMKLYTCKYCKKSFIRSSDCTKHERTHTGVKPYTCKHCNKCFNELGNCKRHERTHTGVKPYTCKHCNKCFSQSSSRKRHEEKHAVDSSLKSNRHGPNLKLREPTTTQDSIKSSKLFSLTQENLIQVESLTCWICQEEFSRKTCLVQHYDDHMRSKWHLFVCLLIFYLLLFILLFIRTILKLSA